MLEGNLFASPLRHGTAINETYDRNDLAFVMTCALPLGAAVAMSTRGARRFGVPVVSSGSPALAAASRWP